MLYLIDMTQIRRRGLIQSARDLLYLIDKTQIRRRDLIQSARDLLWTEREERKRVPGGAAVRANPERIESIRDDEFA